MELVILFAIIVALVMVAKGGMTYLRYIRTETGYNPIGFLNSLLIIGFFVCGVVTFGLFENGEELAFLALLGTIACIGLIVYRNRVLGNPMRIILVTFFQIFAPALTLLGIAYKKSGGIMGNAVMQSNLGGSGYVAPRKTAKKTREPQYSTAQDAIAMDYGYKDAEDASRHGLELKKYL